MALAVFLPEPAGAGTATPEAPSGLGGARLLERELWGLRDLRGRPGRGGAADCKSQHPARPPKAPLLPAAPRERNDLGGPRARDGPGGAEGSCGTSAPRHRRPGAWRLSLGGWGGTLWFRRARGARPQCPSVRRRRGSGLEGWVMISRTCGHSPWPPAACARFSLAAGPGCPLPGRKPVSQRKRKRRVRQARRRGPPSF